MGKVLYLHNSPRIRNLAKRTWQVVLITLLFVKLFLFLYLFYYFIIIIFLLTISNINVCKD